MNEYLSVTETAQLLACSPRTVWEMIKAGRLRALRLRGSFRIPRTALDALAYQPKPAIRDEGRNGGAA